MWLNASREVAMVPIGMQWDGGKGGAGVAQWLINQMPPHRLYVEPFLGGGTIMRLKLPALSSIGIERDAKSALIWEKLHVPGLSVSCGDGIAWLEKARLPVDALVYCDPPYLLSTRIRQRRMYRCELSEADHVRLLTRLRKLRCRVMISGYESELYASLLSAWRSTRFQTIDRVGRRRWEWVWMNFEEATELHDYRYLGSNFRERERIKRKVRRWTGKLRKMALLERRALLVAMRGL